MSGVGSVSVVVVDIIALRGTNNGASGTIVGFLVGQ